MISKDSAIRPPTLADVAAYASVSPKTVSNVVNNRPYITEETRAKVRHAISALGYRPSALARSLVTGRTNTIGIVIPDVSNPFFGQAILGCERVLSESGYHTVLGDTGESVEEERRYLDTLTAKGVDGLIIWGGQIALKEVFGITAGRVPIITVDSAIENLEGNVTAVNVNNENGATEAVQHLISSGRRRIGHLAGPACRLTARKRQNGYGKALSAAGIELDPCLIIEGPPSIRGGYRSALRLLENQKLDALFCYNDLMAIGSIVACNHLGISIPADLALIGFDDITVSALITPSLTTVHIAQYELGRRAGTLLLDRLHGRETEPKSVDFPVELRVRNSCGTKTLSQLEMRDILENLVSSVAVDLPEHYPGTCKKENL
jgi:DNA-binding LacI/PurR family transcriptional regulator